ncbi:MAG: aminoacyl-tRNA hydrolase [Deltaproteobacteria bacterium]|nr:aminoacyl-tRNA hydrolase [Deltaproteobacteria bacterium]MBW2359914.1 aminoacyl-tRNA hydrolase [Deltaproteobacteria bacterium]
MQRGLTLPGHEIRETASRASGPGGQHVNKTSTRVTLRWNARDSGALTPTQRRRLLRRLAHRLTRDGELLVHASRNRSRARNRELARERLAELVRDAVVAPRRRIATRPSRGSQARRVEAKRARSAVKRTRRPPRDD